MQRYAILFFASGLSVLLYISGCGSSGVSKDLSAEETAIVKTPLQGEFRSRTLFENPYANIPAQCYIETSYGTQNACLFCHTNAPARIKLGNSTPQAGASSFTGDLQLSYAFTPANQFATSPNINPWENTLRPQKLDEAVQAAGLDPAAWDMQAYIRADNWNEAYAKRLGSTKEWDSGYHHQFRLFPGLNPTDLPAEADGFVRTSNAEDAFFRDGSGNNTGWRAVNFMPYGIFTPHTGSVSGIYIRLAGPFMQDDNGDANIETYKANLALLERAIHDRLETDDPKYYYGKASDIAVNRGLYPIGTEFAHPLHYVDVDADGSDLAVSPYPGTRSRRVKEVRYMYKYQMHYPGEAAMKEEDGPLYYNKDEGWIDNGAGWHMSAFIEKADGSLRAQTPEELLQCVGCHSDSYGFEPEQFSSGTGNTIDTTWAFPRKFAGDAGWKEMDYLGYKATAGAAANETAGSARRGDPINRDAAKGEYRYFLEHVVGASLYGVMPASMERYLASRIDMAEGYSAAWPPLDTASPEALHGAQKLRLKLMREFTQRKDYIDADGYIQAPLLFPTREESLEGAGGYRKVVATQRYTLGKDVFPATPFTYRYYRGVNEAYTHIDDVTAYNFGEIITDRPYDHNESFTKGVGIVPTLVDKALPFEAGGTYDSEYMPLMQYPQQFESR